MAKVIGFNEDVAKKAIDQKKIDQRNASIKNSGRNIHFVKSYQLANPVLKG